MKRIVDEEAYNKKGHLEKDEITHNHNSREIVYNALKKSTIKNARITIKYEEETEDDKNDDNDMFNMFSL